MIENRAQNHTSLIIQSKTGQYKSACRKNKSLDKTKKAYVKSNTLLKFLVRKIPSFFAMSVKSKKKFHIWKFFLELFFSKRSTLGSTDFLEVQLAQKKYCPSKRSTSGHRTYKSHHFPSVFVKNRGKTVRLIRGNIR